jgi:hypothetical protein
MVCTSDLRASKIGIQVARLFIGSMQVVESMYTAAVDILAHALPITGPIDAMVADCGIPNIDDDKGDVFGALKRPEIMAVCKHASGSEVASASEVAVRCKRVADLVDVADRIAQLRSVLPGTVCCRAREPYQLPPRTLRFLSGST